MKFLSRLDDFEHIVIDGSVSGTGLSSLYLKDTATPILRIGNNSGDSFITYDGSELSISSDVDLRFTTPTDQDVFLITSTGNIITTQAGGTFTIGGGLTLPAITGGFLKTDADGVVSVDNSSYLTAESDTLDSVTDRGATTTNAIEVGNITVNNSSNNFINFEISGSNKGYLYSNATQAQLYGGGSFLRLTANDYIRFDKGSASTFSEAMRITSDGNVGIGTTVPNAILDVNKSTIGEYAYFGSGSTRQLRFSSYDTISEHAGHQINASSGNGELKLATNSIAAITIDNSQNVGIGGSPASVTHGPHLDIVGNRGTLTVGTGYFEDNGNTNFLNGARPLAFGYSGSEYMRVHSNGNVGIGTTSPEGKLHIYQPSGAGPFLITRGSDKTGVNFQASVDSSKVRLIGYGDALTFFTAAAGSGTNASEKMRITSGGNVGIGTSNPSQSKLVVDGDISIPRGNSLVFLESITGAFRAKITSQNTFPVFNGLEFYTGGVGATPKMVISDNGNLQLTAYGSGLLTSDASGNITVDTTSYSTFSGDYDDLTNKPTIPVSGTDFDPVGTDNSTDVTLDTTSYDYLSITGQEITLGQIDYDTDITNTPTLGTAAATDSTDYATAAQGSTADSALQPGDADLTPSWVPATDPNYLTSYTETQTLDDVTDLGATTTNGITVGQLSIDKTADNTKITFNSHSTLQGATGEIGLSREDFSTSKSNMSFYTNNGSGLNLAMRIKESGKIGIGVTNPGSVLHVQGDGSGILELTRNSGTPHIFFKNTANTGYGRIYISDDLFQISSGTSTKALDFAWIEGDSNGNISFPQYGAGLLKTNASGAISLDTTSYSTFSGDYDDLTNKPTLGTAASSAATDFVAVTGDTMSGNLSFADSGGNTRLNIGNITGASPYVAKIWTGNYHLTLEASGTGQGQIRFNTGTTTATEKMRILENGKVGIGTSDPSSILHISSSSPILTISNTDTSIVDEQVIGQIDFKSLDGSSNMTAVFGSIRTEAEGTLDNGQNDGGKMVFSTFKQPTSLVDQMVIDRDGNVGIGTDSPNEKLTIVGDGTKAKLELLVTGNTGESQIHFGDDDDVNSGRIAYNHNSDYMSFYTNNVGDRMIINSSGNVGIGTTNPSSKLEVKGASGTVYDTQLRIVASEETGAADTGGSLSFVGHDGSAARTHAAVRGLKENSTVGDYSGYLSFDTRANNATLSEKMRILGNGNVGIGTDSPGAKLDVQNAVEIFRVGSDSGVIQSVGSLYFTIDRDDSYSGNDFYFGHNGSGTSASTLMTIKDSGNVGIGTTSPGAKLEVREPANTESSIRIRQLSYNYWDLKSPASDTGFAISDVGGEKLRITSTGRVGIGTTNPSEKLDVSDGNAQMLFGAASSDRSWLQFKHNAVPADGEELGLLDFRGYNDASQDTRYVILTAKAEDVTDGSEDGSLTFQTMSDGTATQTLTMRSGNVGIGTSSPSQKLEVGGSVLINHVSPTLILKDASDDDDHFILFKNNFDSTYYQIDTAGDTWNFRSILARDINFDTSNTRRMVIAAGGNVGIGTTSPGHKLHVYVADSNGMSLDGLQEYTTMRFQYNGSSKAEFVRQNSNKHLYLNNFESGGIMSLINNGNTAIRIDSSNNVGVGHDSPDTNLHVVGTAETRLRVGSSNASSNVVLELRDENTPTGQGTVITYNNATGETYFNNAMSTATTDFHFQSGEYGTANDFFTLSNSGGNAILHLKTTGGDSFITYENATNELAVASDGDLRLTTPTDQDVFFISSGGNIETTQAGGSVSMGGDLVVDGDITGNSNAYFDGKVGIGTTSPALQLHIHNPSSEYAYIMYSNNTTGSTVGNGSLVGIGASEDLLLWNYEATPTLFATSGAERMRITPTGNVGIGTTSPDEKLHVNGNILSKDATGNYREIRAVSQGAAGIYFGNESSPWDFYGGDSLWTEKGGSILTTLKSTGEFGIGTTNPGYKLDVSGTIRATGDVIAYSDARVKENVETIPNALDKVKAMRGVGYNKIGEEKRSIGVIAQEMLEVMPEVVSEDQNGMLGVAYGNLVGVLIEAVKELEAKVESLEAKLDGSTK